MKTLLLLPLFAAAVVRAECTDELHIYVHEASGPVFEAAEPDFLDLARAVAEDAVRRGEAADAVRAASRRLTRQASTPEAAARLPAAQSRTVRRFHSPALEALAERAASGTAPDRAEAEAFAREVEANFRRTYLFLDAESEAQRRWLMEAAKGEPLSSTRIVAVSGSLARLRALDLPFPIGFDQSGYLVRRFAIGALPARVRLDAHGGVAEEIPLDEKGRVIPGRATRLPDLLWGRPGEPDRYLPTETP